MSALRNKTVNRSDIAGEVCEKHLPKSMSPSVSSAHSRNDGSAVTPSATQLPQHSIEPVTGKLYILMKVPFLAYVARSCRVLLLLDTWLRGKVKKRGQLQPWNHCKLVSVDGSLLHVHHQSSRKPVELPGLKIAVWLIFPYIPLAMVSSYFVSAFR